MIEIYSKEMCGQCETAKILLKNNGMPFTEYKLDHEFTREELIESFPTARTFPVVLINGNYIGGLENLKEWIGSQNGKQVFCE